MDENAEVKTGKLPLTDLDPSKYGVIGIYDVVNNYDWTLAPSQARDKVPIMKLVEYELDANALLASLKYWTRPIFKETASPYEGLYRANPTGVEYIFPWFEDYHHNITQNWEDFKGIESTSFGEKVLKGINILTNSPGISINTPKIWKGVARATVTYNITLFNTTTDSKASIKRNKALINRLIASTLHDQQNPILAGPPALYSLEIPGVRYCPACVLSNLIITNLGTFIKDETSSFLPEAYKISFTLNELITESRQVFEGAIGNSKVKAFVASNEGEESFLEGLDGLNNPNTEGTA